MNKNYKKIPEPAVWWKDDFDSFRAKTEITEIQIAWCDDCFVYIIVMLQMVLITTNMSNTTLISPMESSGQETLTVSKPQKRRGGPLLKLLL